MDLERAIEIARESKDGGYDSMTDQALQFLHNHVEQLHSAIEKARQAIAYKYVPIDEFMVMTARRLEDSALKSIDTAMKLSPGDTAEGE